MRIFGALSILIWTNISGRDAQKRIAYNMHAPLVHATRRAVVGASRHVLRNITRAQPRPPISDCKIVFYRRRAICVLICCTLVCYGVYDCSSIIYSFFFFCSSLPYSPLPLSSSLCSSFPFIAPNTNAALGAQDLPNQPNAYTRLAHKTRAAAFCATAAAAAAACAACK